MYKQERFTTDVWYMGSWSHLAAQVLQDTVALSLDGNFRLGCACRVGFDVRAFILGISLDFGCPLLCHSGRARAVTLAYGDDLYMVSHGLLPSGS